MRNRRARRSPRVRPWVLGCGDPNPTLPAAQLYEGEVEPWLMSDYCTEDVPVLMRRRHFCSSFAADARDFRSYNSWVLSLMLAQVRRPADWPLCIQRA